MLRNDNPDDMGVSRGTHYVLLVAALIVGLVAGLVVGVKLKSRQAEEVRFSRDLTGLANAATNLTLAEMGNREQILKMNHTLLLGHAASAYKQLPSLHRTPLPNPQLMDALGRANAYAQRHKLQELGAQLTAIRDRIAAQGAQ
jgi:hypothetical protein